MERDLIINDGQEFNTIVLLEDGKLVEVHKEKKNKEFSVGDIFIGKVKKVMNSLNAAFVDIGYEKDAFLHYNDLGLKFQSLNRFLRNYAQNSTNAILEIEEISLLPDLNKNGKISEVLTAGQKILVQIMKEPISSKGPRVTSEISIAGRNLVLIPFSQKVSISQKIKEQDERERLKLLLRSVKPNNYGIIIRTVAKSRRVSVLDEELNELKNKWLQLVKKISKVEAPALLMSELDQTSAMLRDLLNNSFTSITVDSKKNYNEIKDYLSNISPESVKILKYYQGKENIFEHFGVERQIKTSFGKIVNLKKGAYLIIEKTEALIVIDVNSGNKSSNSKDQQTNAFEVNQMAVDEIARQLRLRDLGGIIVIDLIDMYDQSNRNEIFRRMKAAMQNDRAKHNILPITKFGLMQITRQRIRPEIEIETLEMCPVCEGTGQIQPTAYFIDEIEQTLKNIVLEKKFKFAELKVHPFVYAFITKGLFSKRLMWCLKFKMHLKVTQKKDYHLLEFDFFDAKGNNIQL